MAAAHHHDHTHHQALGARDWATFARRLELEWQVAEPLLAQALDALSSAVGDAQVHRILDLGSGPGTASVALAKHFPDAQVTAVDASSELLSLIPARAANAGVADRVATMVADLEQPLDGVAADGFVDVVWASMVLHHLQDLPEALRSIRRMLRPGGVLAIVEFGGHRRALPVGFDVGCDGFAERHAAAVRAGVEEHLPAGAMELDWPSLLSDADFQTVDRRDLVLHLEAPLDEPARQLVLHELETTRRMTDVRLDEQDLALQRALVDPDDPRFIAHRDDLPPDMSRTLLIAR